MPSKKISQMEVNGWARGLSINSSDELIVGVHRDRIFDIDTYRCVDGKQIKSIDVGDVLRAPHMPHVIQSSNGNFIIVHLNTDGHRVYLISEVSIDGTKIIRTFDPRSVESNKSKDWWPRHLAIDQDDYIFVADYDNDRVVRLNPILTNRDELQINGPTRLCYVRGKQMLIVGHGRSSSTSVSLFYVPKPRFYGRPPLHGQVIQQVIQQIIQLF